MSIITTDVDGVQKKETAKLQSKRETKGHWHGRESVRHLDASTPLEHLDHRGNIIPPPMKQEVGTSPSTENKQASKHLGTHGAFHLDNDTSASGRRDRGEDCHYADDACVWLSCCRCRSPASDFARTTHQLPWRPHRRMLPSSRTSEQRLLLTWMREYALLCCQMGARLHALHPSVTVYEVGSPLYAMQVCCI